MKKRYYLMVFVMTFLMVGIHRVPVQAVSQSKSMEASETEQQDAGNQEEPEIPLA